MIDEDGTVTTYGELEKASDQFALGLRAMGVCPGDRVALQLPNTHEFLVALMPGRCRSFFHHVHLRHHGTA
ncbi:AMP-binding protein [Alicyclobacillus acidocaldarius]|uniref:AMP-binding protein n=1 Tax=Alicyclobacillus acidocaldarius TaxID=405212 RepID=UPI00345E165A